MTKDSFTPREKVEEAILVRLAEKDARACRKTKNRLPTQEERSLKESKLKDGVASILKSHEVLPHWENVAAKRKLKKKDHVENPYYIPHEEGEKRKAYKHRISALVEEEFASALKGLLEKKQIFTLANHGSEIRYDIADEGYQRLRREHHTTAPSASVTNTEELGPDTMPLGEAPTTMRDKLKVITRTGERRSVK